MEKQFHILIVEDGEDQARILKACLSKAGFKITRVENGLDAFEMISQKKLLPDLLLTDIMMPGISGFELLSKLKDAGILPPTIVLTGKKSEEDIVRGLELGALDYISKPFSPTVVVAKIRKALQIREVA